MSKVQLQDNDKPAAPDIPAAHPAFEYLRSETVASLNLVVEEYRHRVTGARHYHLAAGNEENVFLVAFRTVPGDSTGVAHMLEHTVLCGSNQYPVRDPFFLMIRRSLNTFMNAFTSSDWTAYPFASKNRKDFNNLMDVYLDAVFFPRIHELDFAQEGHRLEFSEPGDHDSDLVFKGVVFNEMKGAMSSPISTLWQTLTKHLFPTMTYHYNSGGDPEHIPDLGYAGLKSFYETHYHPSNAVFMTYGDIPAHEHQRRIEEQALARFPYLDIHIEVGNEKRLHAPISVEESYALDESEQDGDKTHIVMGWLLGNSTDLESLLKAHLLSSVLLDNGSCPLRYALETTDLGSGPSPLCGVEDSNREMSFICGIEGSRPEHAQAMETLVLNVLRDVVENGIPQDRLEAVLHRLELDQREISGDSYPYGLQLILEGLPAAIHRGDPVAVLNLDPVLEQLRAAIQDPDFIRNLVREWLLENTHRIRLTLKPDKGINARREAAENDRLAAIKASLDETERLRIVKQAQALAARQAEQEDEEILPRVEITDIPARMHIPSGTMHTIAGLPVEFYAQGTNGLVYEQIITPLPALGDELLEVLPYYTACLTELGCGDRDYLQTQAWQYSVSGGVHSFAAARGSIRDPQDVSGYFVLSGKALARNHAALSELMQQTFERVHFDEPARVREIIAQHRARREQGITGNGHALAMTAACSGMNASAALAHRLRGLAGIRYLRQLDDSLDNDSDLERLLERFRQIHEQIHSAPRQFLLVGEDDQQAHFLDGLQQCWQDSAAPGAEFAEFILPAVTAKVKQGWTTSTRVNFCAKAYPTVPADHEDAAALAVLAGFLRNGFLHRAIREQGGAYGGGASHDPDSAALRFYSYRDPRLSETLADFDRSINWLLDERHEWRQVEEAILGVVGAIDKPGSPAGDAKEAFHNTLFGRTPEMRRNYRARVLDVTLEDLRRVGETYLNPDRASVAVITSASTLEQHHDLDLVPVHL